MLAKKAWKQFFEAGAVVRFQQARQADAVGGLLRRVLHQVAQQHPVQALPHFTVGIAEPVQRLATEFLFSRDGQVAGLEQQRLGADFVHVERRQQILGTEHFVE